ncbi:MAG: entericidin A/B family lipoprotein [Halothiobacillaceae bacterium]
MKSGFAMLFLFVLLAGLLGGCSTVEGFGKDVEKGGQAIERAAQSAGGS